MVQSIFLLGVIVAPTLGPTLGGCITDNASWHWCFFINLPIGMVSAFLVMTFLHDPPNPATASGGVDWIGIVLLIVGVGSLQYVLEEGNIKDWFASRLLVNLAILSAISLVALIWWQLSPRNTQPIIKFARPEESRSGGVDLPVRRRSASGSMAASSFSRCSPRAFSGSRRPRPGWR